MERTKDAENIRIKHPVLWHGQSGDVLRPGIRYGSLNVIVSEYKRISAARTLLNYAHTTLILVGMSVFLATSVRFRPPINSPVNHDPSRPGDSSSNEILVVLPTELHPPYLIRPREHPRHQLQLLLRRPLPDVLEDRDGVPGGRLFCTPVTRVET
ncbi:hypothetical protein B0H14DRAFT_1428755 [Mycena olivaceomarginata]|nr:hypothetical protein B0H14DRAFT_1428755 [Mycena olivaceomarginata]